MGLFKKKIIGELDFSVRDSEGKVIDSGRRVVHVGDLGFKHAIANGEPMMMRSLRVTDGFEINIADPTGESGIGIGAHRVAPGRGFGFSFFMIQPNGMAIDRDSQRLRFSGMKGGRMEFVDDIEIGISNFEPYVPDAPPHWRIQLKSGSWIDWLGQRPPRGLRSEKIDFEVPSFPRSDEPEDAS